MFLWRRIRQLYEDDTILAGGSVYLFSNVLNAAIPFMLLPVLTRFLSPAEYGQVAMFQTLIGVLGAFIGLSVAGAAGRKYYDEEDGPANLADFIGVCLQILSVTTTLALLLMLVARESLSEWLGLPTHWLVLAVTANTASIVLQIRLTQWQVRKQAKRYGAAQVGQGLVNVGLSLLLVVVWQLGPTGRVLAETWAVGLFAIVSLWLLWREGLLHLWVWRPDQVKEALRFGVPLIPHTAGIFLLVAFGRLVINMELGLAEVGVYMVAAQLAGGLGLLFDAVNKAYVPWLFEQLQRNIADEKVRIVRFTYTWFIVILCASACAFLVGPWVVQSVAGQNFSEAGDIIGWLALGQIFGGMYLMVTNYIFFSKRTGLLSLASITSGVVNAALLLVLVPWLGIKGAAFAFCGAMALRFMLTWWVAQLRYPMPWLFFIK